MCVSSEIIASMARILLSPCGLILVAHNEKAHLLLRNGISGGGLHMSGYEQDPICNTIEDRFETILSVRVCPAVVVSRERLLGLEVLVGARFHFDGDFDL